MSAAAAENSGTTLPVKVLYIAGPGRVGSTLLGRILGQIPKFTYTGELKVLWRRNLLQNQPCGCGLTVPDCPIWREVLGSAFGDLDAIDARQLADFERRLGLLAHVRCLLPGTRPRLVRGLEPYVAALDKLYRAVAEVNGCRVIVDSSHVPLYGVLLQHVPSVEVSIVHLTRDARAVAYSWQRRKVQPNPDRPWEMRRPHPTNSALWWSVFNVTAERYFRKEPRFLFVRYEDFIARPRDTIESIVQVLGETPESLPFVSQTEVVMSEQHTVFGNPDRFKLGTISLRPDMEWQTAMQRSSRAWVNAVAWPLLWHYGYYREQPATG